MKRYSGLIFSALFPYVIVLAMFALFNDAIMINIFQSNAFLLIGSVLLWWGVSLISLLITMVIATQRKWDSCELAKVNMILKTAQIPAYVIIFLAGLLCMITVFGNYSVGNFRSLWCNKMLQGKVNKQEAVYHFSNWTVYFLCRCSVCDSIVYSSRKEKGCE